ncbi:glycosyltransferase family 2 protein [Carboxylicivirga sp. RSCT41]|uniref:glycosyltransferase family 2 protein n=1 Tax=Carboxylicivirga agarovorans TaxID=3417570 RepID=UPI003D32AA81
MKVLTIVVTYNGQKWIDKCFESLLKSKVKTDIFVIDNKSSDRTVQLIKESFPSVSIIESNKNLGFGKANNLGLKKAITEDYDYVFLLNQDAWIEENTIISLIEIHKRNIEYGILAPLQLNGDNSIVDAMFYEYSVVPCRQLVTDLLINNKKSKEIYDTVFLNAACWLLPMKTIKAVGGFDPMFPHYGEDNDYTSRVKLNNLKIGLCPDIVVSHDREHRKKSINFKKDTNYAYITYLGLLKNHEMPLYGKSYYLKLLLLNYLNSLFGNNKYHYKVQTKALSILLKNYNQAISHREKEKSLIPMYL